MEFHTLHDFMIYSKGVTYVLMVVALIAITAFWRFLTDRDKD